MLLPSNTLIYVYSDYIREAHSFNLEQQAHDKAMFSVYSTKYHKILPLIKVNSILRMKSRSGLCILRWR